MAGIYTPTGSYIGWAPQSPSNGYGTQTNNATGKWLAYSFIARHASLNEVSLNVTSVTGSLTASQVTATTYADVAGTGPDSGGTAIDTVNCSASLAAGKNTWNGMTGTYTVGAMYWVVFKNLHGTPASNFITVRQGGSGVLVSIGTGTNIFWGQHFRISTDSGTGWNSANVVAGMSCMFGYNTSGTAIWDGILPGSSGTSTSYPVYSTREAGVVFTTPATGNINAAGLCFFIGGKQGTPTANIRFRLYNGTSLVDTTTSVAPGRIGGGWVPLLFSTTNTLAANTTYRITYAEETNSDTSSNYYYSYAYTMLTDTNARSMLPFNGTCKITYYDGSSWTDTNDQIFPFAILCDNTAVIQASGSSTNPVGMITGVRAPGSW